LDYSEVIVRLSEFVQELYQYYLADNHLVNDQIVVTPAMIGFNFPELQEHEIRTLIALLKEEGHIIREDQHSIIFAESFCK
jgi:hypothetical protein